MIYSAKDYIIKIRITKNSLVIVFEDGSMATYRIDRVPREVKNWIDFVEYETSVGLPQ
jgi:hypothetical protein